MDLFAQGLAIGLTGLTVTFAALGLVVLVVVVLLRVFGHRAVTPTPSENQPTVADVTQPETIGEEVVAAISAALVHLRAIETSRGGLGSSLEAGRGPWWLTGQAAQHQEGRQPL